MSSSLLLANEYGTWFGRKADKYREAIKLTSIHIYGKENTSRIQLLPWLLEYSGMSEALPRVIPRPFHSHGAPGWGWGATWG